ncbi:unnamed protein product [Adineta ricciae]|uniref:ATPase AAA-type core domain-containing protein n=1 Tax=Adineta ricciae TaxID=249248 RepID=A0A813UKT5_ADIRI|nr:unnamed protein product [Adineta ricciae]
MKLTQKTLFQCFQKTRPQSPIIDNSPPETNSSNSQTKIPCEQLEIHTRQPDYIIPVHIRQSTSSSCIKTDSLLNDTITSDDDDVPYSTEEFYRICPTIIHYQSPLAKLTFTKISSSERQMELFEQYTKEQPLIDWKSMFECLQDYRAKAIEQHQCEQLLWTDIYRPRTSKAYLGNHTRQINRLNEWFSYWTRKLHNEQPKNLSGKKRKRTMSDDDDDSSETFDDNSNMSYSNCAHIKPEHPQLIFIHGSGTTSLVHAIAEEHNFKITEINGSQSRARAPLLKQLEQVTSHHQLSFKRCPSDTISSQGDKSSQTISSVLQPAKKKVKNENGSIMSYFNQKNKIDDEQKENKSSPSLEQSKKSTNRTSNPKRRSKTKREPSPVENQFLSSVHVEKASLILFDEIETLTTDDKFWSCLKKLLETAKKPIILTSNSRTNPEDAIINLSNVGYYELIHLEQNEPVNIFLNPKILLNICAFPSQELICCFLRLILLLEMFEIPSSDDLLSLTHSCSNDLRRILLTLQFCLQSSDSSNISDASFSEKQNILSQPKWQSSRAFDAMYYSHLNDQWKESSLKVFFDELTSKYTSEYEQSHLLLHNQSKNNTNRIELYDTFKLFMQEQEIGNIIDHSDFYLDYRPFIRQICQSEHNRVDECNSNRRLRHSLSYRGCSLQWSDFEILSTGIN